MVRTKRGNLRFFRAVAVLSPCLLPLSFAAPAAAGEGGWNDGHVRVQFSGDSSWSEMGPKAAAQAPLPAGPARASYGMVHNAQSAAPQDRLRLKPMNFDGM